MLTEHIASDFYGLQIGLWKGSAALNLEFILKHEGCPHDAISCTQPLSSSFIRKLSLWFQHNSEKESHDTNRVVCTGLKVFSY